MSEKILLFDKPIFRYRKLAEECAKKEDFAGAIRFLTSAKNKCKYLDYAKNI